MNKTRKSKNDNKTHKPCNHVPVSGSGFDEFNKPDRNIDIEPYRPDPFKVFDTPKTDGFDY